MITFESFMRGTVLYNFSVMVLPNGELGIKVAETESTAKLYEEHPKAVEIGKDYVEAIAETTLDFGASLLMMRENELVENAENA